MDFLSRQRFSAASCLNSLLRAFSSLVRGLLLWGYANEMKIRKSNPAVAMVFNFICVLNVVDPVTIPVSITKLANSTLFHKD